MTTCSPSPNGSNGRRRDGKFAAGNKGGPGNPHSHLVAALRTAMFEAVDARGREIDRRHTRGWPGRATSPQQGKSWTGAWADPWRPT
jgi:hypothetical protein